MFLKIFLLIDQLFIEQNVRELPSNIKISFSLLQITHQILVEVAFPKVFIFTKNQKRRKNNFHFKDILCQSMTSKQ
jgi:hypothetical protein